MLLPASHMIKYTKNILRRFKKWMAFNPPGALTSAGWDSFDREFRFKAPIRHWLQHDFKKIFVYPVKWWYEKTSLWLIYRTVDKYHVVSTGLEPGYYELDHRLLHVNFNSLKDFVEVQQARREYWSDDVKKTWCEEHMPFYEMVYPFRRPELGIKHLEWASTLDDPSLPPFEQSPAQAKHARETLKLYKWWVEERPTRVPVEICHPSADLFDIFNPSFRLTKEYKVYRKGIERSHKQRDKWDKEDDAMLVRLMKIRRGLWT